MRLVTKNCHGFTAFFFVSTGPSTSKESQDSGARYQPAGPSGLAKSVGKGSTVEIAFK